MASTTSCTTTTSSVTACGPVVYETKTTNPVIAELAQGVIASIPMTHPEYTTELLTLQRLPWLPTEKMSLGRTLHLTPEEMTLLQGILQKWHFGSHIILQTLLGVDLYHDIVALQIPPKSHDLVLHSFSAPFFYSFLRFDRDSLSDIGSQQRIPTKGSICESLENCKRFVLQVAGVANPAAQNIGCKIDLFIKLLEDKNGKWALADNQLILFNDIDLSEYGSSESRPAHIKDLQRYAEFCHAMVSAANKDKMIKEPYEAFQQLANFCERIHESFDTKGIGEMKTYLREVFQSVAIERIKSSEAVEKAKNAREMRLGKKQLHTPLDTLTQTLEGHSTRNIIIVNLDFLLTEFQQLFDYQAIVPSFPKFALIHSNMQRFLVNIGNCPQALPKHKAKKVQAGQLSLVVDFEKVLSAKLSSIEGLCRNLVQDPQFQSYQTNAAMNVFQRTYKVGYWISRLSHMDQYSDLLPKIKDRLAKLPEELMAHLKTQVAALPSHVTAEERQSMCDEIGKVCFRKSLFLTRMVMILEDVDTILNNRFVPEPKSIPAELEDVMILTGLEELFGQEPEAVEEMEEESEEAVEPKPASDLALGGPVAAPIPPAPPANSVTPGVVKGIGLQKPPLKPKVYPAVPKALKQLTKTEKILRMLRDCGFFERKDSGHQNAGHTIVADDHGRTVPVPRRSEQKPGTVKSMYNLATAPLRETKT